MKRVRKLDAILSQIYRTNPVLLAQWKAACRVHRASVTTTEPRHPHRQLLQAAASQSAGRKLSPAKWNGSGAQRREQEAVVQEIERGLCI